MGRRQKLTDKQWEAIGKRFFNGESARVIADDVGNITEAAIRKRFGSVRTNVKAVANQLFAAEEALKSLPVSSQLIAIDLAAHLRSISAHLSGAANYGAMSAHRLSGLANSHVEKIDDADPMKTAETLQTVAALTKMANASSEIGLNLLRANKEAVDSISKSETDADKPLNVMLYIPDNGR